MNPLLKIWYVLRSKFPSEICVRWKNSYQALLRDMGPKPPTAQCLVRLNPNRPFSKSNCFWGSFRDRRTYAKPRSSERTPQVTYDGQTLPLTLWADISGLSVSTLRNRLRKGFEPPELFEPVPVPKYLNRTPEYYAWSSIKQRCSNSNHPYHDRSASVDPTWSTSFEAFLQDMGPKPAPEYRLARLDKSLPYQPGNCTWQPPRR